MKAIPTQERSYMQVKVVKTNKKNIYIFIASIMQILAIITIPLWKENVKIIIRW